MTWEVLSPCRLQKTLASGDWLLGKHASARSLRAWLKKRSLWLTAALGHLTEATHREGTLLSHRGNLQNKHERDRRFLRMLHQMN